MSNSTLNGGMLHDIKHYRNRTIVWTLIAAMNIFYVPTIIGLKFYENFFPNIALLFSNLIAVCVSLCSLSDVSSKYCCYRAGWKILNSQGPITPRYKNVSWVITSGIPFAIVSVTGVIATMTYLHHYHNEIMYPQIFIIASIYILVVSVVHVRKYIYMCVTVQALVMLLVMCLPRFFPFQHAVLTLDAAVSLLLFSVCFIDVVIFGKICGMLSVNPDSWEVADMIR